MVITDIPILAYHRIIRDDERTDKSQLSVRQAQFTRQMHYLFDHGYQCLSLMELCTSTDKKRQRPGKSFALTFDDGYEDFLTNAYPVLRRFGFTATVFLVTDLVGKRSNWDGEAGSPLLTWKQIQALQDENICFGSHTCTHPHLPALPSEQLWRELSISKQHLEDQLDREVPLLCYPYGESNRDVQNLAEAAGYNGAYGVATGASGRFNIWRSECLRDDSLQFFIFKLSRIYRYAMAWRIFLREQTMVGRAIREIRGRRTAVRKIKA